MTEIKVSKATPSKAALELTEKLFDQMPVMFRIQRKERVASMIQSALSDLLEKASDQLEETKYQCWDDGRQQWEDDSVGKYADALAAALEPWQS